AVELTRVFAMKAGGVASDVWAAMPGALRGLDEERALLLLKRAGEFLAQSGSAALHLLSAGGQIMRIVPDVFDEWCELGWVIAGQGNAALVAFVRASASVFKSLAEQEQRRGGRDSAAAAARRVIATTRQVALVDAEAAISCFRSSAQAVGRSASLEHYEQWARGGLDSADDARARRSYYALETRRSNESLAAGADGLSLESVAPTLGLYIEALTGRAVEIEHLSATTEEARIGDGRTVHLPARVSEFETADLNFRLYKVLAAHAAGQIEFGTHARDSEDLQIAYQALGELYAAENADARDAFALGGYINDLQNSEAALAPAEEARRAALAIKRLPADADYRAVLALFPQKALAARIFGTLENGRIDRRLRRAYRGLARDLDLVRQHLRTSRPRIAEVALSLVPFELLFQITLCGGALDDARQHFGQVVSELETIVSEYLASAGSDVADTLMATSRVYALFQNITPNASAQRDRDAERETDEEGGVEGSSDEKQNKSERQVRQPRRDARELFSAWLGNDLADEPDDLDASESWTQMDIPEQPVGEGEVAFSYDEWDRELSDHRVAWCRVVEKRAAAGSAAFVEQVRERYRGTISSIRHQFQLMKPENLKRIAGEIDGDEYDLNAVIDYAVDRRTNGHQSERLYIKRLRRERNVAVSLLLDQSSSTARTIGRHPLQPYTHPGRRIIEIEKEGLVLMSEALEAVGDVYSINGFTSEGRRNVKFYVVKDFGERYSHEIAQRIGGITYQNNTRLGAAIRHAAARLSRQEERTRLLIILSDGRPYDHDYGDARYAREDTREALRQAKLSGIIPFCITIDRDSEAELRDLYGEVGYTIIDDVLTLPERMPAIYRRLTS
ncbi:MAG: VWA domain-containing protein, partial [Pyrinomonadaceae bacterium]